MKNVMLGQKDLTDYVGFDEPVASEEAEKIIEEAEKNLYGNEKQVVQLMKAKAKYRYIDLSFLSMSRKQEEKVVPVFAIYTFNAEKKEFGDCKIRIYSNSYSQIQLDENSLPHTTEKYFDKIYEGQINKHSYRLTSTFRGLLPTATKDKIQEAQPIFDDIVLVAEETQWGIQNITADPLVIGLIMGQAFLIDLFETTNIENYVGKEFTS